MYERWYERSVARGLFQYMYTTDLPTDRPPMLFVHSRMVRHPIGQSIVLIAIGPWVTKPFI